MKNVIEKFFRRQKKIVFIDYYSLIHIGSGILIGLFMKLMNYKFGWFEMPQGFILCGLLILILWEIFEISLRYIKRKDKKLHKSLLKFLPGHIFLREGSVNIVSDIVIGIIGLVLVYWIF